MRIITVKDYRKWAKVQNTWITAFIRHDELIEFQLFGNKLHSEMGVVCPLHLDPLLPFFSASEIIYYYARQRRGMVGWLRRSVCPHPLRIMEGSSEGFRIYSSGLQAIALIHKSLSALMQGMGKVIARMKARRAWVIED